MTTKYTYKNSQTADGKEYKYVEIRGYQVIPIETHYIKPNESIDFMIDKVCELCEEEIIWLLQRPLFPYHKADWLTKRITPRH